MTSRVMIDLDEASSAAAGRHLTGTRRVDISRKFRRVILLVLVLYALSSFQMTYVVDKVMGSFFK